MVKTFLKIGFLLEVYAKSVTVLRLITIFVLDVRCAL